MKKVGVTIIALILINYVYMITVFGSFKVAPQSYSFIILFGSIIIAPLKVRINLSILVFECCKLKMDKKYYLESLRPCSFYMHIDLHMGAIY